MRVVTRVALLAALAGVWAGSAAAEPLKISMSYIVAVTNWAPMLLQTPGLAKHVNQSYTLEVTRYQGTPLLIQGLASGELQIANMGFTALPLAIVNAGMSDIRVIADEIQDGVPGYFTDPYLVLKDSPIKTVDDLKGHVLGTNAVGSGTDVPLRAMLAKHNLKDKVDLTIIEVSPVSSLAMFTQKKIDLQVFPQPTYSDPNLRAVSRTLFTKVEAIGHTEYGFWVARAPFIAAHRAQLVDFMEDALRQERWYLDPANHKEAVEISARVTKAPPEQFDSWVFRKNGQDGDYYQDPNGLPNIDSLQASMEQLRKLGLLKEDVDVKNYVDLSLVKEAAARLP